MVRQFVDSSEGVRLAVFEQGNPDGPTLVMVHGWPNSHAMWDGVGPLLADRFRIITFDNRGAGESTVPKPVGAYTMAKFADDLAAVIAAVSPGEPVHVLAHDWGSVATWEYLARPDAQERVASFTSVSGPSADHYAMAIVRGFVRPFRPSKFLRSVNMFARLSYWFPFSVPVLTPALMRAGLGRRLQHRLTRGTPADQLHYGNINVDAANSLKIYRAQVLRVAKTARRDQFVGVPVQLVVNTKDPVIVPKGLDGIGHWVPRLWRRDLEAGHWSPLSHPQVMAQSVNELVDHLEGKPASRALLQAEVGRPRDR
ncbi:MAG: alpha/beta fold hydrolase [Mycobacterium sp.]